MSETDGIEWVTLRQLAERLNVSKRTIYRRMDDAEFPPPSPALGVPRWPWSKVVEWMQRRRKPPGRK